MEMVYAVIENGVVANVAESYMALGDNWQAVPIGCPVAIGDSFDGSVYRGPDGAVRLTAEQQAANDRIAQLESEKKLLSAQVQALADRNEFMEDCIAEMAAAVYA